MIKLITWIVLSSFSMADLRPPGEVLFWRFSALGDLSVDVLDDTFLGDLAFAADLKAADGAAFEQFVDFVVTDAQDVVYVFGSDDVGIIFKFFHTFSFFDGGRFLPPFVFVMVRVGFLLYQIARNLSILQAELRKSLTNTRKNNPWHEKSRARGVRFVLIDVSKLM